MEEDRAKAGARAGKIGIICNLLLACLKLAAGLGSGAVSVIGDSVNNFSDVASSLVTLIGFKISSKKADREHPYGHGRVEYISGFIISALVIAIALDLMKTSFTKIIEKADIDAGIVTIIILAAAIVVKAGMAFYYTKVGKRINSTAMFAAAADSRNDCITTSVALISCIIFLIFKINIDGYAGLAVSFIVIWAGIKSAKETIEPLLGSGPQHEVIEKLRDIALAHESVIDVHDIRIHDYGPERTYATMDVELPYNLSFVETHTIIDTVEEDIRAAGIVNEITLHADPVVYDDPILDELKAAALEETAKIDPSIKVHDFHISYCKGYQKIALDVVTPYNCKIDDDEIINLIKGVLDPICRKDFETYKLSITMDKE